MQIQDYQKQKIDLMKNNFENQNYFQINTGFGKSQILIPILINFNLPHKNIIVIITFQVPNMDALQEEV